MDRQKLAQKVVEKMMADDAFSQWMKIQIIDVKPGFVKISMEIRPEMNNGFSVTHGGITYSLADSALAFASNSYGRVALALENNISYMKKVNAGDVLTAETEEISIGNTIGVYNITVTNQNDESVALFRGTVYRMKEKHINK
ncbi:MAG: hotdog fold thioesterase [Balneolaceae bacterium]|nr:hotdog fold thioesterase [Balneolaceae bacterium]